MKQSMGGPRGVFLNEVYQGVGCTNPPVVGGLWQPNILPIVTMKKFTIGATLGKSVQIPCKRARVLPYIGIN